MGLMKKLFGGGSGDGPARTSTQFADSRIPTSVDKTKSSNAPRRELVRLVLRETMRKHGIPSDWMDCRALSVLTKQHKSGMHVQFLVFQGDHQLLKWVHAFQESFWENIARTDPGVSEWLFSVGWEFYGKSIQGFDVMPDAAAWKEAQVTQSMPPEDPHRADDFGDTLPPDLADGQDGLADDLNALQVAMSVPAELVDLPEPPPGKRPPAA